MAPAAAFPSACAAGSLPRALSLTPGRRLLPVPLSPARWDRCRGCSLVGVGASTRRAPTLRRNAFAETVVPYVPGSGKYIAPDYLVRKVSAEEVQELVRGHRKVPLIVDFYATWCGPCVQMAQDVEMLAVEYEDNALFVKWTQMMNMSLQKTCRYTPKMALIQANEVRGLPTLYFFSPDQNKDAIRTEGLIPMDMIRNIIDNELTADRLLY